MRVAGAPAAHLGEGTGGVDLARDEYLQLMASATARAQVGVARPEGLGRALATYEIPIEGRDEWLAAARRLA